jgi:hypothetical protein
MKQVKTDTVRVFDAEQDKFIERSYARIKGDLATGGVQVDFHPLDLDPGDFVRSPILELLRHQEQEVDPTTRRALSSCKECDLYDRLASISERYMARSTKLERKLALNPPEIDFLRGRPRICVACILHEHRIRKARLSWPRRVAYWLKHRK